uniref:Bridging integrator 3 n=2 Tax=Ornithorhynchus anatinus TaxID=9258 RepID=A0A6I8NYY9_ORNAN
MREPRHREVTSQSHTADDLQPGLEPGSSDPQAWALSRRPRCFASFFTGSLCRAESAGRTWVQVERDFEREYGKLQQLEDQTKKLQKDMKKSTDADLAMSKSAVKISSDLLSNPLCEQDEEFLDMVTALDTAMKRMDSFNQEKVNQIQRTVIEPLKKFGSVFPSLNMAVKRREQALQDYKRLQSKVEKYEEKEKTGPVLAKLHQAREELRPVKDDFEAKNKQLLEEMPRFYSSRLDYFQPSFESLIRAQVVYYTEMRKIFGDLTEQLDRPGQTDEQRERENEAKLSELRALSIVADD